MLDCLSAQLTGDEGLGRSPGLVVMGGDSRSEGHGFESQCHILDGHFLTLICCKIALIFAWKRPKINEKAAEDGTFFKNRRWRLEYLPNCQTNLVMAPHTPSLLIRPLINSAAYYLNRYEQCDQIGQFFALWATIQCRWQQLFYPNCIHCEAIFVKVSKSFIFLVKSYLGNFYRHLTIFIWSHWVWAFISFYQRAP